MSWQLPIKDFTLDELTKLDESTWRVYLVCRQDATDGKIDDYHSEVVQMAAVQNAHGQDLQKINVRCAGRRWQGRVIWAALAASIAGAIQSKWDFLGGIWAKMHGG